jgi:hypothetical protein
MTTDSRMRAIIVICKGLTKKGLEPLGGWLERPSNQHPEVWRGEAPMTLWALSEHLA